jgi:hypothetical protein
MEAILARMAGEEAKKRTTTIRSRETVRKPLNRARTIVGRIFRTGTELRGLLEVNSTRFINKQ